MNKLKDTGVLLPEDVRDKVEVLIYSAEMGRSDVHALVAISILLMDIADSLRELNGYREHTKDADNG